MLVLKILGAVVALALGIWLGLPGRYDRRYDEIERAIDAPGGRSKKAKRHFTPLAWVRRQIDVGTGGGRSRSRGGSRGFKMDRPGEERPGSGGGGGAFKLQPPDRDRSSGGGSGGSPRSGEGSGGGRFKMRRPGQE